jgi:hypothetical protein
VKSKNGDLQQIKEEEELTALTIHLDKDLALKNLWGNERDSIYDENLSN